MVRRWYYGKPWEHFEDAWRQSPLAGAAGQRRRSCCCRVRATAPIHWARPRRCIARCGRGCAGGTGDYPAKTMDRWVEASLAAGYRAMARL